MRRKITKKIKQLTQRIPLGLKTTVISFLCVSSVNSIAQNCTWGSQSPAGTINVSSNSQTVVGLNVFPGTYSVENFTVAGQYALAASFGSYFTVTDNANNPIISGPNTLTVTIPSPGLYRIHLSSSSFCGTGGGSRIVALAPLNRALNFDGVNDYVNCGSSLSTYFSGKTAITEEAWIYPTSNTGAYKIIAGNYNTTSNGIGNFFLRQQANDMIFFINGTQLSAINTLTLNTWQHIAGTWDGSTIKLYVNGALKASVGYTATMNTTANDVYIGYNNFTNEAFQGNIDELRIWNRALCQGEIQNNMSGEISTTSPGLLANYHFNQGVASGTNTGVTSLVDDSGNSNTGTLSNFALTGSTSNWIAPGAFGDGTYVTAFVSPTVSISGANGICNGSSTTLTASGNVSAYNWLSGPTTATNNVSPTTTTTYSVVGTNSLGCLSNTATITLSVSTISTSSAITNVLCNGATTGAGTVTATGGISPYSYLASNGSTLSTQSGLPAGLYTYTVTDNIGCTKSQVFTITQPTALVTSTAVTNVLCNGGSTGSATLTVSGGTTPYSYMASNGYTTSTLPSLVAGTYNYTVTDNNGCIKTQAFTITEPSALAAGTIINPILCNGANDGKLTAVGIQGTAPYTYSWSTGATTSTIVNVSPGVYTATVTDANGCVAVATKTVTEPSPVTITITASSSNICAGSSSTLTASASGGMGGTYTYTWVAGPTSSVSVVSPTTSTIYTISVEDGNSCVKSSTINIVANVCAQAEALNFDGSNDYVSLPTNPVSGDFTIEYWVKTTQTGGGPQWYGGIGMVDAEYPGVTNDFGTALVGNKFAFGIGNPDVTIVSSTNINDGTWHHVAGTWVMSTGAMSLYVDGVLESTGVGSTNPRNVPTRVTIGSMQTLFTYFNGEIDEVRIWNSARTQCEINTYKNCEVPSNATNLVANYHFNQGNAGLNNAGLSSLTDATSNSFAGTLTNFALNGTTSNWVAPGGVVSGYTATAPAPTVTVNSGAICAGQSFTMMPMGADTYTYSGGSDVVMPTSDASYTVTGTDANGCSNTAVSTVTVNPLPSVTANSGNVTTCGDVSADFGIVATGNNNTYEWHFDQVGGSDHGVINGTYTEINFNTDTMTIQQVLTGQYAGYYVYCYVTNEFGCVTRTANDTIVANLTPTITVNSGAICAGQSFTMVPSGANTYTYSGGSSVVMPTADASYTVTGTDLNGCENTAVSTVAVNALPSIMATTNNTLLCTGETATLSVMGANTYTWSTTENTSDIVVSPTVQTTYTVDGTDVNGCMNTTTITQDVSLCTGIATLSNDASINVYPNPNNGLFTIEVTTASKVTVTNALGQVVIAETFDVGKHSININNESTGVYFVKVMTNNKQQIIKVIKE